VFNRQVAESVAQAVADAAVTSGVARRERGARADEPASPLEQIR
jgi:malic enzyme